jgi:carbon monoxide dehydrogenase subunit G
VKLDLQFDVQAPIDAVWRALNDLDQVAPCLPGAAITGREDGVYHGEFTLRVGPFATVHRGSIRIDDADDGARVQRLTVVGSADHGATIVSTLSELEGATRVDAVAEIHVAGPLAAFVGSGVIRDVANHLLRDFATCLAGKLCDTGICGGDVPPLIGQVLTGTGLTLAQAATRLERGELLSGLTDVQRRIVEDYALEHKGPGPLC